MVVNKNIVLFFNALLLLILLVSCNENKNKNLDTSVVSVSKTPNIILLMADDQGWGDTGYNDHPYLKTPTLDGMADNGAVFQRFYAASAVCSPTRGSVMTGRHPLRFGVCHANCGHIKSQEITLGEMTKSLGYSTGHFGKWHLGTLTRDTVEANRGGRQKFDEDYAPPWDHGFDVSFVTESKVPTWNPMITPPQSSGDVNGALEEGKPFNTSYWKGPGQIETENLEGDDSRVIMDRVIPFIEHSVNSKTPFLSIIWFHTPHLPVLTSESYRKPYADLSEDQQHYYGVISAMDNQIGRLRSKLKDLGVSENTILFYTSDNGPEGRTIAGRKQGTTKGLRGRKRSLYEGGIRVPGIIEWKGKIKPGTKVEIPCFTSDYFPTIAHILGVDLDMYNRPYDGVNMLPIIESKVRKRNKPLAFEFQQQAALNNNNYKIYSNDGGQNFELYNTLTDPREQNNIAEGEVEKLQEMILS